MTSFIKENFIKDGDYCLYPVDGKREFVARFKHVKGNRAGFIKFLCKHFTVEEYFTMLKTPNPGNSLGNTYAPAETLESKGYVSAHILKWLKEGKLAEWKGHGYDYWKSKN